MKESQLIIEKKEYVLLKQLMNLSHYHGDVIQKQSIKQLSQELTTALIYDETQMPREVIRLNSTVEVSIKDGWQRKFQLVPPNRGNIKEQMVSILSPMGAAVMGHSQGDVFKWRFPSGEHEITIMNVEQEVVVSKIGM